MLSPLTSYTDQILSIHRTRTSAGFSLDIPLIMLSASILKIFYWPGARYDTTLLIQAVIMVIVQVVLLKVALDNRPWRARDPGPFRELEMERKQGMGMGMGLAWGRPGGFWRWHRQRPYWECLAGLVLVLMVAHTIVKPTTLPSSSSSSTTSAGADGKTQTQTHTQDAYTRIIGYVGLAIEAILPIPQLAANQRASELQGIPGLGVGELVARGCDEDGILLLGGGGQGAGGI